MTAALARDFPAERLKDFANGAAPSAFAHLFSGAGGTRQQQTSGSSGGGFFDGVMDVAGKIWALPNTIVGLAAGGLGYGVGWAGYGLGLLDVAPGVSIRNNAVWFENIPFGEGAITIGNAVISTPGWGRTHRAKPMVSSNR